MVYRITLSLAIFALLTACHRNVPSEFQAREWNGRGYRVYVPPNRDPNKKLPVMLFLHGSGSRGDDNVAQVDGFRRAMEPVKDKIDFIVVLPQCDDDTFWAAAEHGRVRARRARSDRERI